ncbi:hypothetical protein BJ944DRAFT_234714 [Cunninghamella echinulata]|nr:hypothetical protein BJ944DRAFT_234714 [Cunninghamella echinulata]
MADYNFVAVQKYGYGREYMSKFSKIIKPGESACCHFENRDCNGGGTKDDLLVFSMYSEVDAGRAGIREVGMLAGGYLIVTGNPFMPNIDTFDANGNPFQYRS